MCLRCSVPARWDLRGGQCTTLGFLQSVREAGGQADRAVYHSKIHRHWVGAVMWGGLLAPTCLPRGPELYLGRGLCLLCHVKSLGAGLCSKFWKVLFLLCQTAFEFRAHQAPWGPVG